MKSSLPVSTEHVGQGGEMNRVKSTKSGPGD